jgi:CRISPR/Cas system-associated endoribonuclease Cas2
MVSHITWLLLVYKVPAEPAAKRIAVWRKLKAMGAVYLQNSVCLTPETEDSLRRLKMVENEIEGFGGEAVLLKTAGLNKAQEEKVITRFTADRDEAYREFIDKCTDFEKEIAKETAASHFTYAELEENDEDLEKLKGWLTKIKKLDFYTAPLSQQADAKLKHCIGLLEIYAKQVFEAHEENLAPDVSAG